MDLVIPIGKGSTWIEELKYILRSWDKNYENLDKVYLIGEKAWIEKRYPWLKDVVIVNCDDPYRKNKDANIIRKVIRAIDTKRLSDPFIRTSDDQYVLKKIENCKPVYSGDLKDKSVKWWNRRILDSRWKVRLKNTFKTLQRRRLTTFNYDVHFPLEVHHDFKAIITKYYYISSAGYVINTLYFNNSLRKHKKMEDIRGFIGHPMNEAEIRKEIKDMTYLTYLNKNKDQALNAELKKVIKNKFRGKSRFEK